MAIARDSITLSAQSVSSSRTTAHTTTGSNPILVCFIYRENNGTISGNVTYNGVALTYVGTATVNSYSPAHNFDCYILINPATGTNNLAYTLSGSVYNFCWIATYTEAQQSGQPDASSFPAGTTGTSKSTNITTVAPNAWIVGVVLADNGGTITATGAATIQGSTSVAGMRFLDSNGPIVTPASTAFGFSTTVSGGLGLPVISFAPSVAAVNTTDFFHMM